MEKPKNTTQFVKIPLAVHCYHKGKFIFMDVKPCDPEVPSYSAICPKCKREIIIDFQGESLQDERTRE